VPEFILLKASAGSGKTYRLAERFLSFLLKPPSDSRIPQDLANILAITFTKNAAREMKERILAWLKECSLGDSVRIRELGEKLGISPDRLPGLAEKAVERILAGFTEFQVTTIDSFITTVFRASAVDLGTSPDFEVVLDPAELIDYAFSRFLRTVVPRSSAARDFERILEDLVRYQKREAGYLWDPAPEVEARLAALYGKLTARAGEVTIDRFEKARARVQKELAKTVESLEAEIAAAGLELNPRSQYWSKGVAAAVRDGRTSDLIGLALKMAPVKKPGKGQDPAAYGRIEAGTERLRELLVRYGTIYAKDFFTPYLETYAQFLEILALAKRRRGVVFLEDMARRLADYLRRGVVPDIYLRLGERIFHFLVDEFQDTSPIQWADLRPLIEESLSQGGSLFVVGDTKQAIYGFRDADYEIMRRLEFGEDRFGPAEVGVQELTTNWRCRKAILDFVKRTFLQLGGPKNGTETESAEDQEETKGVRERYSGYADRSGLSEFEQKVEPSLNEPGFVEYAVFERKKAEDGAEDDGPGENVEADSSSADDGPPEKKKIQDLVAGLCGRGYSSEDIAILTYKNETVVQVASWLNENKIPFIPFSSLDIRLRRVVREILALLRFLDSPPDDLSFAAFLLGDVFRKSLEKDRPALAAAGAEMGSGDFREFLFQCRLRNVSPLYPAFRERYSVLWDRYFEKAFRSVGYFPLYDLVVLIYRLFGVWDLFPDEEAALARLLEAVKEFEGRGRNDILEFLARSASDVEAASWTVDVPREIPAVRVMSIHKAKGLGFPVVILLLYGQDWQPPDFYLDEKDDGIRVYKITSGLAEGDPDLGRVYGDQKEKDWVGLLNMLYVAMTRARAELYIVGVKGGRHKFPFDLIEAGLASANSLGRARDGFVFQSDPAGPGPALREKPGLASPKARRLRFPGFIEPPPNLRESLHYGRIRRGEVAHRILAELEEVDAGGWEAAVAAAVAKLVPAGPEEELFAEVGRSIVAAFEGSPLGELFVPRPGRRVFREFDFSDAGGRIFRMDRVVVDAEAVQVIDFKTGGEPDPRRRAQAVEEDRAQVREYAAILRDIYPGRRVGAILAYLDLRAWEEVR
jgi:ATP-dependent exoDNAse (exonuclease V) beta subunit